MRHDDRKMQLVKRKSAFCFLADERQNFTIEVKIIFSSRQLSCFYE